MTIGPGLLRNEARIMPGFAYGPIGETIFNHHAVAWSFGAALGVL